MGWLSLVGEGLSLYEQNQPSNSASNSQQQGSDAQIAERQREFDLLQHNLQPYMDAGTGGLSGLDKLAKGDYSGFNTSPDFLYAKQQAIDANDHSAAARGRLYSGGYPVDLANSINGIASQNLGNYRNSLQYLASLGQNSAAGVGNAATSMGDANANSIGNAYNARANNALSQGDNWANAISQFASSYGAMNNGNSSSANSSGGGTSDPWGNNGFSWDTYGGWG